jgi:hypothetical protein
MKGGSPAYRLFQEQGLLNQQSIKYDKIPLTYFEKGFSDHIVATTGGGKKKIRRSIKKSKSKRNFRKSRSKRNKRK